MSTVKRDALIADDDLNFRNEKGYWAEENELNAYLKDKHAKINEINIKITATSELQKVESTKTLLQKEIEVSKMKKK